MPVVTRSTLRASVSSATSGIDPSSSDRSADSSAETVSSPIPNSFRAVSRADTTIWSPSIDSSRNAGTEHYQRDEHQRNDAGGDGDAGTRESGEPRADSRLESVVGRSEDDGEQTGRQHVLDERQDQQGGEPAKDGDEEGEKRRSGVHISTS